MEYVQTITGKISPDEMGITLTHEHVLWDLRFYLPKDKNKIIYEPITLENVADMPYNRMAYEQNLYQLDEDVAIKELSYFKNAGGKTVCDNGCYGLSCDPLLLKQISLKTGVNILKGTGVYVGYSVPDEILSKSTDELAKLFIIEITEGIDDTGIKCSFIGEIGVEGGVPERSVKFLTASAIAQKETGAPIFIHQPGIERQVDKIFDVLTKNGGDLNKTVMCHCDPHIPDHDYISHIAKSGAYVSFDFFGLDIRLGNKPLPTTDNDRFEAIAEQISRGNQDKLLISHDTAYKFLLRSFGGHGYAHIIKNIIPIMLDYGISKDNIDKMTITNAKKLFTISK